MSNSESEDGEEADMDWLSELIDQQMRGIQDLNDAFSAIGVLLSEENLIAIRKLVVDMVLYNDLSVDGERMEEAHNTIDLLGDDFFRGLIAGVAVMLDAQGMGDCLTSTAANIYHNAAAILFERTGVRF